MTTQASIRPLFLAACILLVLCSPFLGMSLIHPSALLSPGSPDAEVFWRLRLPRTVAAFLAGSGLAMSGMVFQAMFRNPLATPFTLGVSSGAAFGASLYFRFGAACSVLGAAGGLCSALLGGLLSMLLVYLITRARGGFSTPVMLLAGVIINFFFSSLVMFIQYWSDAHDAQRIMRWLMGSLTGVEPARIADLAFIVMAALLLIRAMTSELDLLTAGEELAASRGVAVHQTKIAAFAVSSVMVGAIVSVTGPIGFVGMMAPHLCRLWFGWSHRILLPNAFMLGGCFLVVCDLVSRSILAPAELPIGIITAMVGGPFFCGPCSGATAAASCCRGLVGHPPGTGRAAPVACVPLWPVGRKDRHDAARTACVRRGTGAWRGTPFAWLSLRAAAAGQHGMGASFRPGEADLNPVRKRRRNRGRTPQNSHCLSVGRRGRQTDPEVGRPISSSLWVGRRFLLAMPAREAVKKPGGASGRPQCKWLPFPATRTCWPEHE